MDRNMSFSAAPFKMTIPVFIVADGEILVNFDVLFAGLGVDSIALERITQTDLKKKEYPHEIRDHYIDCEHRKRVKVELPKEQNHMQRGVDLRTEGGDGMSVVGLVVLMLESRIVDAE